MREAHRERRHPAVLELDHGRADRQPAEVHLLVEVQQAGVGHRVDVGPVLEVHRDRAVGVAKCRDRDLRGVLVDQNHGLAQLTDLP